jgi:hypothetical protein
MSKETFWQELDEDAVYTMLDAERIIERIEYHGGLVIFPLPTPEGAGCTCPSDFKAQVMSTNTEGVDFDKSGYWHTWKCAMHVPF